MNIVERGGQTLVQYRRKLDDGEEIREFSPLAFLAKLSVHIPDIWEQTTRCYGHYAARTRGRKRAEQERTKRLENPPLPLPLFTPEELEPERPASRQWAIWIKKVYEVDPLKCPKCGEQMRIRRGTSVRAKCDTPGLHDGVLSLDSDSISVSLLKGRAS